MSRKTLSFSVANILGDKSPVAEDTIQHRFAQLKSPYIIHRNVKREYSTSCIDTQIRGNYYTDHNIGNGDDGFLEVCSTSHSPLSSPLPSTTSPFALRELSSSEDGDEVANGDCVSPDAKTHSDEYTVTAVEDDVRSPKSKDKLSTPKRGRMRFSPEQVQVLERRFQEQHYLLPADRKILSLALRLSERQVKTWFQNKRAQYKRTRPLVRSPVYHTVSPTVGCRSMPQLWVPGSPNFHSSPSQGVGISLKLMCSSPSSLSPLWSVATPTHPTSPCNAAPTFFQMPASPTLNFMYPTVAATQVQTIAMSAPK